MIIYFVLVEMMMIIGMSNYSLDTFNVEAGNTYYIAWDDGQISWEDFHFVLIEYPIPENCTWTVNMYDSAGDGWEDDFGNSLNMQIKLQIRKEIFIL